jgi:hypothetical protein
VIARRLLLLMAALWPVLAVASGRNAGTSGAQFLKIGAGARPTALGDAFVGVADDANAVYYNPAGLGFLAKTEFIAMHTQYFQGLDYDYGAFVRPLQSGALGVSAATLKTDALTRRDNQENETGSFTNQDSAYALSYGRPFGERFSAGVSARWVRENIDSASAQTWSADVGALKRFEQSPLTLGLAVRHLGGKIKFNDEGDPLPLTVDAGAGTDLLRHRLLLSADLRHVRDAGLQYGAGAEWRDAVAEKFRYAVRAGYNSATTDVDGASGLALGAGAGYKSFDIDCAWVPFGDLGNTFRYAAHVRF